MADPHCKIVLDKIEALIQGKADHDAENYSLNGRSLSRYSWEELEKIRAKYQAEYNRYLINEDRKLGKTRNRKIQIRFT
jgi:hypothetical protein